MPHLSLKTALHSTAYSCDPFPQVFVAFLLLFMFTLNVMFLVDITVNHRGLKGTVYTTQSYDIQHSYKYVYAYLGPIDPSILYYIFLLLLDHKTYGTYYYYNVLKGVHSNDRIEVFGIKKQHIISHYTLKQRTLL